MKKLLLGLLVSVLVLTFVSCATPNPMQDSLSATRNTGSIEIRVYSVTDQTYTDYVLTDRTTVREICDTFASLKLEKTKLGMYQTAYMISFLNANGVAHEYVSVVASETNVICYDNQMYRLQNDADIEEYVASLVEKAHPKE